jgi:Cd2+/Zn2+-exporting ATPase
MDTKHQEAVILLAGLGCANCSAKIEQEVRKLDGIKTANIDFAGSKLYLEVNDSEKITDIALEIEKIASGIEAGVSITGIRSKDMGAASKEARTAENEKQINQIKQREQREQKVNAGLVCFVIGVVIFTAAFLLKLKPAIEIVLFLVSYLLVGGQIIWAALRNFGRGKFLDENFLMFIATVGALAIQEYPEAVAVMLFYRVGEFFQDSAVNRSRRSISELMDIRPDYANLMKDDSISKVPPEEVREGQMILIKPGEKVPLDGTVLAGRSVLDTSALTGEFIPRGVEAGSSILAGFINKTGVLTVKVTKVYEQSTVARILDLVEKAASKKAKTENFITTFARVYTPMIVLGAALLAFLPPLFIEGATFSEWLNRALVFLVVSCPCALVISIPLSFFGGIGGASRNGILIKGSNYLEGLNQVRTVVFDKTGTLTEGVFEVTGIQAAQGFDEDTLLEYAAAAEYFSGHPIAASILKRYNQDNTKKLNTKCIDQKDIHQYQEIPGYGVKTVYQGKEVIAGSARLLTEEGISLTRIPEAGTIAYIAIDRQYAGYILITDRVKKDVPEALWGLRQAGVKKFVMLTGDTKAISEQIGQQLGFDRVYAELLPDQKVAVLEALEEQKENGSKLVFVGDGVNDAPVLARADIGVAMGGLGSDAAIEAADIVLMTDEPAKLLEAIRIARKTKGIVWQNIGFALGIKIGVLILGAMGAATMWEAVFADVGVAVIAILNAMRVLSKKKVKEYDIVI